MTPRDDTIEVAGVRLTSPHRVLFPEQGISKAELARYYVGVADHLLPQLRGRPLTLVRCPSGRQKHCFVQRRADASFPASLGRVEVETGGEHVTYLTAGSLQAVLALVQLGVLELHTWGARRDRLDRPDRMIFDLDPAPDVAWPRVVGAAFEVRDRLAALGLQGWVKTTGGKGLHVVVPLVRSQGWDAVRDFARRLAERMAAEAPERYLAQATKGERAGRIYLDYLRNAWSASAIAACSPRARAGAPVSTPITWEELEGGVDPAAFTVRSLPGRLRSLATDPWAGYAEARQSLTRAARAAVGAA
jgi:bifunctional non-homologous end joining protein LigD